MAVLRMINFTTEPELVEEMLTRRAALIAATRAAFPGLTETRLARVDERIWVDMWRWESAAQMQAAVDAAPTIPGVMAAFATTAGLIPQVVDIVDER